MKADLLILVQADKALLRIAGQRQETLDQIRVAQHMLADLEQTKQEVFQAGERLGAGQIVGEQVLRAWLCRLHTEHEALQAERDHILSARLQALGGTE